MGVYADSRLSEGKGHYQIGGFSSYALQREKFFNGIRYFPVKPFDQLAADRVEGVCFCFVESDRVDRLLDGFQRKFEERLRGHFGARTRNVPDQGEEAAARRFGHGIFGSKTQEAGD